MNCRCAIRLTATLIVSVPMLTAGQPQLVACDLVDQAAALRLLGAPIKQHTPNRQTQPLDGGTNSACTFWAERSSLFVNLTEYPTVADAARGYASLTQGGQAMHTPVTGVGDSAAFSSIASEVHGYTIRRGKRVLSIDSYWKDGKPSASVREGLRSMADSALRRM